jgi:hypothetical protein
LGVPECLGSDLEFRGNILRATENLQVLLLVAWMVTGWETHGDCWALKSVPHAEKKPSKLDKIRGTMTFQTNLNGTFCRSSRVFPQLNC